jgi:hypothetical protein
MLVLARDWSISMLGCVANPGAEPEAVGAAARDSFPGISPWYWRRLATGV